MAIATIDPATGKTIKTFEPYDARDIEKRIACASSAAPRWAATPVAQRAAIVRRAGDILEAEKEKFGRLMTLEMGKTLRSAIEESAKCATGCRYYAEHAAAFLADEQVAFEGEKSFVAYQPIGPVLAVMPWNFPFWQVIRFAAPALCAGNVGLLKHASNVPQCALALEDIFRRAGAPEGVFQTLLIASDAVASVIADPRVKAVTLTGSEPAGREVATQAGRHIKPSVLELGGSDPFVVMPSVDVPATVTQAISARNINNGQSCIAAKRFIVHNAIYDEFERGFVEGMKKLVVGDPNDAKTDIGPLATRAIRDGLLKQVQESVKLGARLVTGGKSIPGDGWYFEPTVLADAPTDAPAYRDELFGPVATLFRARDIDDAIRIANDTDFGLGASAWTQDPKEAERFAREIESGMVFINSMVVSHPAFPFGGVKHSGYGRELADIGMRAFQNIKTVRMKLGAGGPAQSIE